MKGSRSTSRAARSPAPPVRSAEVVLDIEVDRDCVHLVLENCGDAVATEIQVQFSQPLVGVGGSLGISDLPVFRRLGVLRPGRALRIFWDAAPTLVAGRGEAAAFVATVSWNERSRPRQRVEYHHDLAIYRQWPECLERGQPGS